MPPDEPTEEEQLEELSQDQQTPFTPADPNPSTTGNTSDPLVQADDAEEIHDTHPQTDVNIDSAELYDEGLSGAVEVEDSSAQSAVTDYTPPADKNEEDKIENQSL